MGRFNALAAVALLALASVPVFGQEPASGPAAAYFSGKTSSALKRYSRRAAKSPASALEAAFLLSESGHPGTAAKLLAPFARKYPDVLPAFARYSLDSAHCRRAAELYAALLSTSAPNAEYALGLGRARFCAGDLPGAVEALKLSLSARQSSLGWYFLGRVYQAQGMLDQSEDAYKRVLEDDSQFIEARELLGELSLARKNYNEAWKQYRKLEYADPRNQEHKKKAEELSSLITQKPDELLPPLKLENFTKVSSSATAVGLPVLRVAIGTGSGGLTSAARTELPFSVSGPFEVLDGQAVAASGKPLQAWTVRFDSSAPQGLTLVSPEGKESLLSGKLLVRPKDASSTIILRSLTVAEGTAWGGVADRELRGQLELRADSGRRGITAINVVPIEEYLYGVISSEMPWYYPMEALKAQAVLARTYAYRNIGKHSGQGYDLCDSQHCQVYGGVSAEKPSVVQAVDATRGAALFYEGKPVEAVFSSNSGGVTSSGKDAGWADMPYWASVSDLKDEEPAFSSPRSLGEFLEGEPQSYSSPSNYVKKRSYRWERLVPAQTIQARSAAKKDIGSLLSVSVAKRSPSGRVAAVKLRGSKGSLLISKEYEIRKYLSAGLLRSTFFTVESVYAANGALDSVIFRGAGWGHGVGFCQSGSSGRAEAGQDYIEILSHYYPGTELGSIAAPESK
ncbi:MAG: SpoIID/LytB domain-containing protein [Elusimicrobia bacterium]|nr:SpoIID/LytB domain-containing protein [Elusimicrobiota bacterium]